MNKFFKTIIGAAAITLISVAVAQAEPIGQLMNQVGQSGQAGTIMSENARYWNWGSGNAQNQGAVAGTNNDSVQAYPGGPSPQGSQLPDLVIMLEEEGLI